MPKIAYKCSYCGTVYDTKMDARWCEILHSRRSQKEKDRQYRDELLEAKKDPCDFAHGPTLSMVASGPARMLTVGIMNIF